MTKYEQYRPYIKFIKRYKEVSNASTGSKFDANANVENKNVTTLTGELPKELFIGINRLQMGDKLYELYGEDMSEEYLRQLDNHEIYKHDETNPELPYCVSITMYPFLFNGMREIGGISEAPKNLQSFCGSFVNLVFAIAAQFAGAVSTPEFLTYMDYFIRIEYGDDYYKHPTKQADCSRKHRSIEELIFQYWQEIVYSLNQPAAARNYQSVFWNIAYFDQAYFNSIFEDFVFPDGSAPNFESVMWLQRRFMKWFNQERLRAILTFPVETANLLSGFNESNEPYFDDDEFADFIASMWAEGHSFFMYTSQTVDSLASCCFSKDTKVLWKTSYDGVHCTTLEELYDLKWDPFKKNLKIFHNGFWVSGKPIKLSNRKIYEVTTSNNKTYYMTDNHINVTLDGEKETSQLTTDDYLAFNTNPLEAIPEKDEHLTYEQGFIVGAFLGNGSFGKRIKGTIYETNFSQNANKYLDLMDNLSKVVQQMQLDNEPKLSSVYNNVYPVRICSKKLVAFIQRWINWKEGTYAYNKELNLDCLLQSKEFRQGILDGWYNTDGGNSNRCYTTSSKLAENMEVLITSLGLNSVININDRTNEKVIIREEEYDRNYPLYCVRWYEPCQKSKMDNVYLWKNNTQYFKVNSIKEYKYDEPVYCIERNDTNDPYFTLPSGLITHNCRLRNELQDNTFSYTLGAGGVATGSKCVITINFNRLIQNTYKSAEEYQNDIDHARLDASIREQVRKVHKYLIAYNSILECNLKAGLMPVYDAGYINMDKQFLTIGINGLIEGAEYLGIDISPNDDYFEFCTACLKPIYEENKAAKTNKIMFNTEYVPAENLGVKNAKWDKEDGYFSPRDCYNSYFYKPDDDRLSIIDKLVLHGEKTTKWLDGGSALHMNLEEHLSQEQYKKIMLNAVRTGCGYLTFNIPNTVCNDCGYISKHKFDKCPRCGSENVDWATRVIGYLKRVSKFSEQRQIEASKRYYINGQNF